jgi:hypothetical protein
MMLANLDVKKDIEIFLWAMDQCEESDGMFQGFMDALFPS